MEKYDWNWYAEAMSRQRDRNRRGLKPLLNLISRVDALAQAIVTRPSSPVSDRPQDYVGSLFATRVLRSTISAVDSVLAGYGETAYNLQRTIWEIGVRSAFIGLNDPVGGSFGLLLDSTERNRQMLQASLEYRQAVGAPIGNLGHNLQARTRFGEELANKASSFGYRPNDLVSRYAHKSIKKIADELGIQSGYEVTFAWLSGYVHDRFEGADDFTLTTEERRGFIFGPLPIGRNERRAELLDTLQESALALRGIISLVGEHELEHTGDELLNEIKAVDPVPEF